MRSAYNIAYIDELCSKLMPKETPPRTSSRWEGTHTYARNDPKRPRTAAQVREEALRKIKEDREKRTPLADRRRSLPANRPVNTGDVNKEPGKSGSGAGLDTESAQKQANGSEDKLDEESEVEILSGEESGEMPGSNKKKRHASNRPGESSGASGDGVDKDLKAFLTAMKDDINRSTKEAVDRIDKRIDENAKHIGEIKQDIERRDASIAAKITATVREEVAKLGTPATATSRSGDELSTGARTRRERAYNRCRRTLKIWPISGDNLEDEVRNFLANMLKFDQAKIDLLGAIDVVVAPGRQAKEKGEVLAVFETKEDRDTVKAGGIALAGEKQVGMSIHVPGHLMDNFAALNGVAYSIKMKHTGVKRAVKFDDIKQDVYLDICINGSWKRVTPTKARTVMEKMPATMNSMSGASLSLDDLSNLVQGEVVGGLTAVVVPDDNVDQPE